ncbi:MAG: glycosyltransferase [Clostridia bacterium]|nr:glycosyltransferase [Clostridia bacterium]
MRIGQFCDTFPPELDGVGMVVRSYATELEKRNEKCYLITPEAPGYDTNSLPFEVVQFKGITVPLAKQYKLGIPALDQDFRDALDQRPMDILHAHSPFAAGFEAVRVAKHYGVPLVGTFHSKFYDDFYQATHSEFLAHAGVKIILNFFNACDEVWAVSAPAAEVLREYGFEKPIIIMPNGTDLWYPTEADKIRAEEQYALGKGHVLLFVGQQDWKKNIRHIVEAIALYRQRGEDFKMVMVGQGPSEKEIHALVAELGLKDHFVFTGQIMDRDVMMGLYARADLFVFPSLYDTSGLVVREAAAAGTPSLLIANSCAAEVVRDEQNGFLCEDTPESIADRIAYALSHPELLQKCGEQARESIPVKWSRIMDDVCDRYRALIEKYKK